MNPKRKFFELYAGLGIAYSWPGNIRELKNTIESASVIAENGYIEPAQLSSNISGIFSNSDQTDLKLPVNLPLDEANEFYKVCKSNGSNASATTRSLVQRWLENNK